MKKLFDWYGALLLIGSISLIVGSVAIALLGDPICVVIWVTGLTAVLLAFRAVWKYTR